MHNVVHEMVREQLYRSFLFLLFIKASEHACHFLWSLLVLFHAPFSPNVSVLPSRKK